MECIYCGNETKVVNSRPQKLDFQTWRRRKCLNCNAIVTTTEAYSLEDALRVEKKNGSYEPFKKDKLFLSVYRSVDHINNPVDVASGLTATVLRHMLKSKPLLASIPSGDIAKHTSAVLKRYNAAAAVRYLSFQANMQLPNDVRRTFKK